MAKLLCFFILRFDIFINLWYRANQINSIIKEGLSVKSLFGVTQVVRLEFYSSRPAVSGRQRAYPGLQCKNVFNITRTGQTLAFGSESNLSCAYLILNVDRRLADKHETRNFEPD